MAKDINIHLKTIGTSQTKQDLEQTGQSVKKVGSSAEASGRDAEKAGSSFSRFGSSLLRWGASLFGITAIIRGITNAIRINAQAMEEHANIAEKHQKKMLALQYMGEFFTEHPEARKEVAAYAEYGRRPFEEVAGAWYALESKSAGLTKEQKRGIMQESLELGRMEPEADLKSIVEMFSLYVKETREKDINLVQNVIRQTMTKAGAELSEVGQYLPEFLPLGISSGLTGAEAAGLWAYATTRTKEPSKATVGLRNIFTALQGKGTTESQELLKKLGITPEMNFFEQMTLLSKARGAGKFGLPQAEIIAGRESSAILLSMLISPEAMKETVKEVSGAARGDIDIVRDKINQLMGIDETARLEEEGRQLTIAIENIKAQDIKSQRWRVHLLRLEKSLRKKGEISEWKIRTILWGEYQKRNLGYEPGEFEKEVGPPLPLSGPYRKLSTEHGFSGEWEEEMPVLSVPLMPMPGMNPAAAIAPYIQYIYNNQRIFNPVIGRNKEDLGMGPPAPRNLQ